MYTHERYAHRLTAGLPGGQVGRRTDGVTGRCHDYDETSPPTLPPQTARLLTVSTPGRCLVFCHGGMGIASLRATATLVRWVRKPCAVAGRCLRRRPGDTPSSRRTRGASPVPRFRLRGYCWLCQRTSGAAHRLSTQLRVLVLCAWRCTSKQSGIQAHRCKRPRRSWERQPPMRSTGRSRPQLLPQARPSAHSSW